MSQYAAKTMKKLKNLYKKKRYVDMTNCLYRHKNKSFFYNFVMFICSMQNMNALHAILQNGGMIPCLDKLIYNSKYFATQLLILYMENKLDHTLTEQCHDSKYIEGMYGRMNSSFILIWNISIFQFVDVGVLIRRIQSHTKTFTSATRNVLTHLLYYIILKNDVEELQNITTMLCKEKTNLCNRKTLELFDNLTALASDQACKLMWKIAIMYEKWYGSYMSPGYEIMTWDNISDGDLYRMEMAGISVPPRDKKYYYNYRQKKNRETVFLDILVDMDRFYEDRDYERRPSFWNMFDVNLLGEVKSFLE